MSAAGQPLPCSRCQPWPLSDICSPSAHIMPWADGVHDLWCGVQQGCGRPDLRAGRTSPQPQGMVRADRLQTSSVRHMLNNDRHAKPVAPGTPADLLAQLLNPEQEQACTTFSEGVVSCQQPAAAAAPASQACCSAHCNRELCTSLSGRRADSMTLAAEPAGRSLLVYQRHGQLRALAFRDLTAGGAGTSVFRACKAPRGFLPSPVCWLTARQILLRPAERLKTACSFSNSMGSSAPTRFSGGVGRDDGELGIVHGLAQRVTAPCQSASGLAGACRGPVMLQCAA